MAVDERTVRGAVVRVCDSEDRTRGTGFFVDASGRVLTCHHVVDGLPGLKVADVDGLSVAARIDGERSCPDSDVVVLETGMKPPAVLPLETDLGDGEPFLTTGFHYEGTGVEDAFPARGTISGRTSVSYPARRLYELADVLVLTTPVAIEQGLSGAPVVLASAGVVVGIVVAEFGKVGGFAVSLQKIEQRCPSLAALVAENGRVVPRYDRYLNLKGLEEICTLQRKASLDHLRLRGLFLRERSVARRRVTEELLARAGAKIVPLVGPSGVGKSWLMAVLADENGSEPTVFLSALRVDLHQAGLQAAVASALAEVAPERFNSSSMANAERLLEREGRSLTVLLDGLNEAPGTLSDEVLPWLEKSFDWIATAPVRLIVSCRPDYWDAVEERFPIELVRRARDASSGRRVEPVHLDDFTDDELGRALAAYALPPFLRDVRHLRHPLLLRFYWELLPASDATARTERLSQSRVFERFVETKSKAVSRAMNVRLSPTRVRRALDELAARLRGQTLRIPLAELDAVMGSLPDLAEALQREGLLVSVRDGVRFAFDELAEFLSAEQAELPAITGAAGWRDFLTGVDRVAVARLPFQLLKLDRLGAEDRLRSILTVLVELAFTFVPYDAVESVLIRTFLGLEEPQKHLDLVRHLFELKVERWRTEDWMYHDLLRLVRQLPIDRAAQMDLLRIAVADQNYFDWEQHHWRDKSFESFTKWMRPSSEIAEDEPIRLVLELMETQLEATFPYVLEWLGDQTLLTDGDTATPFARVSNVAEALLFHFRGRIAALPDRLAEKATAPGPATEAARQLLALMAEKDPVATVGAFQRWVADTRERDGLVADLSLRIDLQALSAAAEAQLEAVLDTLLTRNTTPQSSLALTTLSRLPRRHASALDELAKRFLADDPFVGPYSLQPYLKEFPDRVLALLQRYVREGTSLERMESTLRMASQGPLGESEALSLVDLLTECFDGHTALRNAVAYSVEAAFSWMTPGTEAYRRLVALAFRLVCEGSANERIPLLYVAVTQPSIAAQLPDRERLLDLLVNVEENRSNLTTLLKKLAANPSTQTGGMSRILRVAERLDGEPWGPQLFAAAFTAQPLRDELVRRSEDPDLSVVPGLVLLRERLASGIKAKDAVLEIAVELRDGAKG